MKVLVVVLLGQLLSILVTGTGVFTQSLSNMKVDASTFQVGRISTLWQSSDRSLLKVLMTYSSLFFVYGPLALYESGYILIITATSIV